MDLFLRRIVHPQARDNYRVILKLDDEDIEIGSVGIQNGVAASSFWTWGIDTVVPMRDVDSEGKGTDRRDCMQQFKAAWERFSADPARLTDFLNAKRKQF